jgi:hypothetical protein
MTPVRLFAIGGLIGIAAMMSEGASAQTARDGSNGPAPTVPPQAEQRGEASAGNNSRREPQQSRQDPRRTARHRNRGDRRKRRASLRPLAKRAAAKRLAIGALLDTESGKEHVLTLRR